MTDFLTIDGYRLACSAVGSPANPPVILIHGLMSHRGVWNSTIEKLKESFYCIAFDLLGFGESEKPLNGDYSIARQAERVLKVADHFGFEKVIVMGHSMGGQIATYLAASLAPQRVRKLVSVDGVVTGKLAPKVQNVTRRLVAIGQMFPAMYSLSRKLVDWKPMGYWMFSPWFYKPAKLPFDSWKLDRRMAVNPETARSTPLAWNSVNATDLTPCLGDITAPTLVIFGIHDGTVPVEQAHLFKTRLPNAQLVIFDDCGHFPMYEKFNEYRAVLETFLAER